MPYVWKRWRRQQFRCTLSADAPCQNICAPAILLRPWKSKINRLESPTNLATYTRKNGRAFKKCYRSHHDYNDIDNNNGIDANRRISSRYLCTGNSAAAMTISEQCRISRKQVWLAHKGKMVAYSKICHEIVVTSHVLQVVTDYSVSTLKMHPCLQ
jgi:hypothetical protein